MPFQIKRNFAGNYEMGAGGFDRGVNYIVCIEYRHDLKGWIAAAQWDRFLYTDPIPTFRDAKRTASTMLSEIAKNELKHACRVAGI